MKPKTLTEGKTEIVPLFRKEALDAATQNMGSPIDTLNWGLSAISIFILLFLCCAIFFLTVTPFSRKETVSGSLVPSAGLLPIISPRSGIISRVFVEEGEYVDKGDPIAQISADSILEGGERYVSALSTAAEGQERALLERETALEESISNEAFGMRERIEGMRAQSVALNKNLQLFEGQAKLAEETVRDLAPLVAQQIISRLQYREAETRLLSARQSVDEAKYRISELEQSRTTLKNDLLRMAVERKVNHAAISAERFSAKERLINNKAAADYLLVSQQSGIVSSLQAKLGVPAISGRSVATLLPSNSQLLAEIWIPSSAIAFVQVGTEAKLMYDAFPYQKFGLANAKVIRVASSPTTPEELPVELQSKESRYRALLKIDSQEMYGYGKSYLLTPGLRLRADLILERRSILDWLLDPILAMKRY